VSLDHTKEETMQEPITLNDANLDETLAGEKPVLLLLSTGDGLRGDFSAAFKKAVDEHTDILFAQIDPQANPETAARFEVSDKPVMIGWYHDEQIVRRSRPWGSDVPLAIEMLQNAFKAQNPDVVDVDDVKEDEETMSTTQVVENTPFIVTDDTFEAEVINYSRQMPVLVDFWAEWCGPCKMVSPVLEKLAAEFAGKIRIAKVNVDENPGLSQAFRIMSIPNFMAVKDGTIVFNQPGAFPEAAFRDLIDQLIALDISSLEQAEAVEEPVAE
jgi:thioredoxin